MTDDELWAAIDAQRLRTATMLDQLTEEEWNRPSLCEAWTVRDVAAHLTLQQMTIADLPKVLKHLGGINTVIRDTTKEKAKQPKEGFSAEIRAMVGQRRHNLGVTKQETLIDILVHSQDIAIPLGRPMEMDVVAAAWAADRIVACQGSWMMKVFHHLPLEGLRLTATDTDWTVGEGPEIRGPISAILLLLTGRPVAFERFEGEGMATLAGRV